MFIITKNIVILESKLTARKLEKIYFEDGSTDSQQEKSNRKVLKRKHPVRALALEEEQSHLESSTENMQESYLEEGQIEVTLELEHNENEDKSENVVQYQQSENVSLHDNTGEISSEELSDLVQVIKNVLSKYYFFFKLVS